MGPRQKAAQVAGQDTQPILRDLRASVVKLLSPAVACMVNAHCRNTSDLAQANSWMVGLRRP